MFIRHLGIIVGVVAALCVAACSDDNGDSSATATVTDAASGSGVTGTGGASGTSVGTGGTGADGGSGGTAKTYPAGPYGQDVGETLADFTSPGYRLAPGMTFPNGLEEISLGEFYDNESCSCIVVTYTGGDSCTPCVNASKELSLAASTIAGLCAIEAVADYVQGKINPGTEQSLNSLALAAAPNHPIVLLNDAALASLDGTPPITGIPTTFVVDPATMKVGTRVTGGLADYAAACSAF